MMTDSLRENDFFLQTHARNSALCHSMCRLDVDPPPFVVKNTQVDLVVSKKRVPVWNNVVGNRRSRPAVGTCADDVKSPSLGH